MTTYRLESLADLLREPDPGPTPMLVEDYLAANAIGALIGPYKAWKTWVELEIAAAVATGRPAFGELEVQSGPVVLILEESSRTALHRRMDMLRRGWAQEPEAFEQVHYSANQRIRLNDTECRDWLLGEVEQIRPALTGLDPFVRLKGADVDENDQRQVGHVLDFFGELRDRSGGAVLSAITEVTLAAPATLRRPGSRRSPSSGAKTSAPSAPTIATPNPPTRSVFASISMSRRDQSGSCSTEARPKTQ
jgi:AAA domain